MLVRYIKHKEVTLTLRKHLQLLATLSAAWSPVGHGLLTGYTAQAIPSMMKDDSQMNMTESLRGWISNFILVLF